jgi:hypothetical protein
MNIAHECMSYGGHGIVSVEKFNAAEAKKSKLLGGGFLCNLY